MDRLYAILPTPYGDALPTVDEALSRVYREDELGEARQRIADLDADQFDVDDPDAHRLYELSPVARPVEPSWQAGGDARSVSRRRAMDLITHPNRNR